MEQIKKLFSLDGVQDAVRELARKLDRAPVGEGDKHLKEKQLSLVLTIFANNAEQIDMHCQTNIAWIGNSLAGRLQNLGDPNLDTAQLDEFLALLYRFVVEFDLSVKNEISLELRIFQTFVKDNLDKFSGEAQNQILYARQEMPVSILKQLLNTEEMLNVRNVTAFSKDVDARFSTWENDLATHETTVKELEKSLRSYETAFNFVGLYDGFNDLANEKRKEQKALRRWMIFFGILVVLPLLAELSYVSLHREGLAVLHPYFLISTALISLSLTFLLIYFFKITLRSADSCKAQLLQLELRKTLCRFIQSYATYSKDLKAKNGESLVKFENIIFSGIVSNDDKLPSTFDGIEQMAKFINAIKAK